MPALDRSILARREAAGGIVGADGMVDLSIPIGGFNFSQKGALLLFAIPAAVLIVVGTAVLCWIMFRNRQKKDWNISEPAPLG